MSKKVLFGMIVSILVFSSCVTTGSDTEKYDYKVIVIGSGPAGLTAGIYTSRGSFDTLVFEGDIPGGVVTETPELGNWPGETNISGYDLMEKFRDHAQHEGCTLVSDTVTAIDFSVHPYKVSTLAGKTYTAQSIIIGTGTKRKKLGCPGEEKYWGRGVSVCATCDALFYRGKTVVVAGGGHTALTEAHYLTRFAKKVIVIHRSGRFRVADPVRDKVLEHPSVQIIHDCDIQEIVGDGGGVTGIVVKDKLTGEVSTIPTDGVFVAIGFDPNVELFHGQLELDESGFLKVWNTTKTSTPGVFAAGDVTHRKYQQVVVAAGDGCRAALDCIEYLDSLVHTAG